MTVTAVNRSAVDSGDGNRFVVRADELLTAFLELESAVRNRRN